MSEQGKWISVKDRLPTPSTVVLTFDERRERAALGFLSNGGWLAEAEDPIDRIGILVTHWQPLPPPPPKPDAFEEFWNRDVLSAIGTAGLSKGPLKAWCKQAFEAGAASEREKRR